MIQNNITVTKTVKQTLQRRAQAEFGDADGWLRVLIPDNKDRPVWHTGPQRYGYVPECPPVPPDYMTVVLGGGYLYSCGDPLCNVLTDNTPGAETKQLLSLERKRGILAINAYIFDEQGKIVTVLDSSRPHLNKNNIFDWRRPDSHTLDVIDQRNRTVLHIQFLNPQTIYVEGLFYNARGLSAKITRDSVDIISKDGSVKSAVTQDCAVGAMNGLIF
jgi:hypothetical protein